MYLVNQNKNEAISLQKKTFKELGFKERKHLQEWICKNPSILGENLLIIQKEFSGFDETNERLDLLAIDETGNLVIIENKLDDTGRDVIWQSLKYASYCASLSKSDIRNIYQDYLIIQNTNEFAEDNISGFLGMDDYDEIELNHNDQRIIMVAAKFRKEITSTALWLLDHNIKVKCIKVTPFILNEDVLIDTEQIIPVNDTEDYIIKLANKKQQEIITQDQKTTRHTIRIKFWNKLLSQMNTKSDLFSGISPSKDNWISHGSGYSGINYSFVITKTYARVELNVNWGTQEDNKNIFDSIYEYKAEIENKLGYALEWERKDEIKTSKITYYLNNVNSLNEDDWDNIIKFFIENMIKLEEVFKNILPKVMYSFKK